jgi:DNA-binding NarL/FixJ family response regulator
VVAEAADGAAGFQQVQTLAPDLVLIDKDGEMQELVRAIRTVAAGGTYLSPELGGYGLACDET